MAICEKSEKFLFHFCLIFLAAANRCHAAADVAVAAVAAAAAAFLRKLCGIFTVAGGKQ